MYFRPLRYYLYRYSRCSLSGQWEPLLVESWVFCYMALVVFGNFPAIWYNKIYQAHLVHFLPQTWNQLFLQEALVLCSGKGISKPQYGLRKTFTVFFFLNSYIGGSWMKGFFLYSSVLFEFSSCVFILLIYLWHTIIHFLQKVKILSHPSGTTSLPEITSIINML